MIFSVTGIRVKDRELVAPCEVSIPEHSVTVIRGKNGAGKTLLLQFLFSCCRRDGVNACLMDQSSERLLKRCGVLENIALSDEPADREAALALLRRYGLEHLAEHPTDELSGGEKRILCLFRCLLRGCDCVFLDEPTNDLDYGTVGKLADILTELGRSCAVVIVSHDDRMAAVASRLFILEEGRLTPCRETAPEAETAPAAPSGRALPELPKRLLRRSLASRWAFRFLMLLYAAGMVFLCATAGLTWEEWSYDVLPNEVDIISLSDASGLTAAGCGAIPIQVFRLMDEELTISEIARLYEDILDTVLQTPVYAGLTLPEDSRWLRFEIRYLIREENRTENLLETYAQRYAEGASGDDPAYVLVDTTDYFIACSHLSDGDDTIPLDPVLYGEMVDGMRQELDAMHAECTWIAVSLQDMDFYEFITEDAVTRLGEKGYFIMSAETIELIRQIKAFESERSYLLSCLFASAVYAALLLCLSFLIGTLDMKPVRILRNHGIRGSSIKDAVTAFAGDRRFVYPFFAAADAVMVFVLRRTGDGGLAIAYAAPAVFTLFGMLSVGLMGRAEAVLVRRTFNWRKR